MKPNTDSRSLVLGTVAFAAVFAFMFLNGLRELDQARKPVELGHFRSDLAESSPNGHQRLFADDLGRKSRFLAFARYVKLPAGRFVAVFLFTGPIKGDVVLEVAADQGRRILATGRLGDTDEAVLSFKLAAPVEVEPRVRLLSGAPAARLIRVRIRPQKLSFPWLGVVSKTLLFGWIAALMLLAMNAAILGDRHWRRWLGLLLATAAFALVVSRAWVSEDAFITMRHVDHLLKGFGPVYNPGERVEGYTHVLWMAIVTLFRASGLSAKAAVMLPALMLTLMTFWFMLFRSGGVARRGPDEGWWINPALPLLLATSGFIDFATSGLETPLSFFLLALYAHQLRRRDIQPWRLGWILALLTLTRPDFIVFAGVISLHLLSAEKWRRQRFKTLLRLWLPLAGLLGTVQVWRMGYYAAWFPNPFYAKTGAGSHWTQGLAYLWDLVCGSPASVIILSGLVGTVLAWRKRMPDRNGRMLVVVSALVHGFFVVRGGGDFMHARFLLPALILFALAADLPLPRRADRLPGGIAPATVIAGVLLLVLALQVTPVQTRGESPYHFGISDERFSYYGARRMPLKDLLQHRLLFIWRTMGQNYSHLVAKIGRPITVAYANIGFLGYYAGSRVRVLDRLGLTDPVTARIRLRQRRRPGHEKSAPLAYLVHRGVTFSTTPFDLWNRLADTPYGVLWDVSPQMQRRLHDVLPADFKTNLDRGIVKWLQATEETHAAGQGDWLFFLSRQWLPYAPLASRREFRRRFPPDYLLRHSASARWLRDYTGTLDEWLQRLHGPMSARRFISNLWWCLRNPRGIAFNPPDNASLPPRLPTGTQSGRDSGRTKRGSGQSP